MLFVSGRLAYLSCMLLVLVVAQPATGQQKTGPGIAGPDSLSSHGLTLYGVVDVGFQYDTHGAAFSDFRPGSSANIVQKNSHEAVSGVTSSNMGQSRLGIQGNEPLGGELTAQLQLETFFNPQSGNLANSLQSLVANNGRSPVTQTTNTDGSSAGQAFQTAFAGLRSARLGGLTFGRQLTLLTSSTIRFDPQYDATAFGLFGASGAYSGGGSTEDKRLDGVWKYTSRPGGLAHLGLLYKPRESRQVSNSAFQAELGIDTARLAVSAVFSKINAAVSATPLSPSQLTSLPKLGDAAGSSLAATVSDNIATAIMALYQADQLKIFAGYERIQFANPATPLAAGYRDIGGYTLAFVNNNAYPLERVVSLYWTGLRYAVGPKVELATGYYTYTQNAYGSGKLAGCKTAASTTCSGRFEAVSFSVDYHITVRFDAYLGAMYSAVGDGVASGYSLYTTNLNPTIGVRYRF